MSTAPSTIPATASTRPGVIQLNIKEIAVLYALYIPVFANGGIFIRTSRQYHIGDEVLLALTLPDNPAQRYPIAGCVAWINPVRVSMPRYPGIGVQFSDKESSVQLKHKIEDLLGRALQSAKPTQTV